MTKFTKFLSYLLVFVMLGVAIAACAPTPATEAPTEAPVVTEAPTEVATPEETAVVEEQPFGENLPTAPTITTPLVVAYSEFSQKFSPFYSDTAYDADVAAMTQISL